MTVVIVHSDRSDKSGVRSDTSGVNSDESGVRSDKSGVRTVAIVHSVRSDNIPVGWIYVITITGGNLY